MDWQGSEDAARSPGLAGAIMPLPMGFMHRWVVKPRLGRQMARRTLGEQLGVALEQRVDDGHELPGDPRQHLVRPDVALPARVIAALAWHEAGVEPRPLALGPLD